MTPRPRLCNLCSLHALRKPYLASLWLLELALAWRVLPEISRELQALLPIGSASEPLMRAMQVALTACVVAALAACLALPAVAAMLHGRLGPGGDDPRARRRCDAGSLCSASAGVTLAGAALFTVGAAIELAVRRVASPELPPGVPAPPIVAIGVVLMIAGGLVTEILCRTHGRGADDEASRTAPPARGRRLGVRATSAD